MNACLIKNKEYRALQQRSGIPDNKFYDICSAYANEHQGRLPLLDEIEEANSESFIRESLQLPETNQITAQNLLQKTNTTSIPEAVSYLNRTYRDKDISVTELPSTLILNMQTKPKLYGVDFRSDFQPIKSGDDVTFFQNSIEKLLQNYGYSIKQVTTRDLVNLNIPQNTKACILNGDILINTDQATIDSPVHEILHLFLGSLRFENADLYFSLVNQAETFPLYKEMARQFQGRARADINEEVFVEELAYYLAGMDSVLSKLPLETLYQIKHNIKYMLDTLLLGDVSVNQLNEDMLWSAPLRMIGNFVQSSTMENRYPCALNPRNAMLHRQLANLREQLLKSGELVEHCI